ncbi:MAG: Uma2 family endonuclease [Clostridiales bacterium]|nr:Uma2 family endonuclease [Clostridiales bacterium]
MSALRKEGLEEKRSPLTLVEGEKQFTYRDYVAAMERGGRWELEDGIIRMMPSANWRHQKVYRKLSLKIENHMVKKKSKCEIMSNFDVRLFADQNNEKAWRPDLFVVCDPKKIFLNYIKGAPDFIVEILSPGNARQDIQHKLVKYREAKVREIWFIDPVSETIYTYILGDDGIYNEHNYLMQEKIPVGIFPGLFLDKNDIFEGKEPPENDEEG